MPARGAVLSRRCVTDCFLYAIAGRLCSIMEELSDGIKYHIAFVLNITNVRKRLQKDVSIFSGDYPPVKEDNHSPVIAASYEPAKTLLEFNDGQR